MCLVTGLHRRCRRIADDEWVVAGWTKHTFESRASGPVISSGGFYWGHD